MINPLALTKCLKALDHLISPRVHQLIKWELCSLVDWWFCGGHGCFPYIASIVFYSKHEWVMGIIHRTGLYFSIFSSSSVGPVLFRSFFSFTSVVCNACNSLEEHESGYICNSVNRSQCENLHTLLSDPPLLF